eukprot:1369578-Prymnesium_polylepis.2
MPSDLVPASGLRPHGDQARAALTSDTSQDAKVRDSLALAPAVVAYGPVDLEPASAQAGHRVRHPIGRAIRRGPAVRVGHQRGTTSTTPCNVRLRAGGQGGHHGRSRFGVLVERHNHHATRALIEAVHQIDARAEEVARLLQQRRRLI